MPNICEGYHGREPFNTYQTDGPWFAMSAGQLRAITVFVGDSDGSFRVEYRGAGYWEVTALDSEGEPTSASRMIYAVEPD
jgi:hypothetical protein